MRVAFTGPSGSGKTTLVKDVAERHYLPWLNGSSGEIKTPEENAWLEAMGLTTGKGHLKVIQSGHANPQAAITNQHTILNKRIDMFLKHEHFVTDRSPIDSWVYFLMQASMYSNDREVNLFFHKCVAATKHLTHVVFVPTMLNPIEDNGSRIPVFEYQQMVSTIFAKAVERFQIYCENVHFYSVIDRNLTDRKASIDDFLEWSLE